MGTLQTRRDRFYIVDVFGEEKHTGNQLAVVVPEAPLADAVMQRLAAEFNFAETTFVTAPAAEGAATPVRIFTPRAEVPFAGHPVLGTAHVIRRELLRRNVPSLELDLRAGRVPVRFGSGEEEGLVWLTQREPELGDIEADPAAVAAMAGLAAEDLDARFPVQAVATGITFLLIPVRTLAAMKKAAVDLAAYHRHFAGRQALPLFLFCPETYHPAHQLNCRMFAPLLGIPEDPATGSANGGLAGYLLRHRYFGRSEIRVQVEQGYEIGRRSVLHLDARERAGGLDIHVGGRVFDVAEGFLR